MRNKDKLIEDLWMQELDPYNDYEQNGRKSADKNRKSKAALNKHIETVGSITSQGHSQTINEVLMN